MRGHDGPDDYARERITPKRFEIGMSGELSADDGQSESTFKSFHVIYNVECDTEDDQARVSRAGDADTRENTAA